MLYLLRCLVYHMLSKMGRNSRNLHRVIAYIYFDAWCITCCWGVSARSAGGGKIPYSSCIFNTAVVVACVIFTHGFSRYCGYWIFWEFCCLFVVCIYIYVRLVMSSYLFFCIYFNGWYITCCPKREALEIYILMGEVLVIGLLVVVCKIPYSSCESGKM